MSEKRMERSIAHWHIIKGNQNTTSETLLTLKKFQRWETREEIQKLIHYRDF